MVVTTTAVSAGSGGAALGGAVLVLLILVLIAKEVAAHSGSDQLRPLERALNIALAPLAMAVAFVLAQHVSSLG